MLLTGLWCWLNYENFQDVKAICYTHAHQVSTTQLVWVYDEDTPNVCREFVPVPHI
jgi:hypothetical protein